MRNPGGLFPVLSANKKTPFRNISLCTTSVAMNFFKFTMGDPDEDEGEEEEEEEGVKYGMPVTFSVDYFENQEPGSLQSGKERVRSVSLGYGFATPSMEPEKDYVRFTRRRTKHERPVYLRPGVIAQITVSVSVASKRKRQDDRAFPIAQCTVDNQMVLSAQSSHKDYKNIGLEPPSFAVFSERKERPSFAVTLRKDGSISEVMLEITRAQLKEIVDKIVHIVYFERDGIARDGGRGGIPNKRSKVQ